MEFKEKTICESCPCLNRDHDECSCNLGYRIGVEWTQDNKVVYCTDECKLELVRFEGREYKPNDRRLVGVRPEREPSGLEKTVLDRHFDEVFESISCRRPTVLSRSIEDQN